MKQQSIYKRTKCRSVMAVLIAIVFMAMPTLLVAADEDPTSGLGVTVGSFEIKVQIQQRRVTIRERGGRHAATVPATVVEAEFVDWDSSTGEVSVEIAVGNVGVRSLFGPLDAHVVKFASPFSRLLNPDFVTGRSYGVESFQGASFLPIGATTAPIIWRFFSPHAKAFKVDIEIVAGVPMTPGVGGVVEGEGGVRVTVPEGTLPYEAMVSIHAVELSEVEAPLGDFDAVAAVKLNIETAELGWLPSPTTPLRISVPNPFVGTDQFIVARQELVDDPEQGQPVLRLVPHDTATVVGDEIVSDGGNGFDGVLGGGLYVFLPNFGSGFVEGRVSDTDGRRGGVVVSNDTNTLVDVSDNTGGYRLYINGGRFELGFFDPLRGSGGSASGNITTSGATVKINFTLAVLANPPITRDGIRNSGFEMGPTLNSWQITGAGEVVEHLVATGATIHPTEGRWMADISTGEDAVGGIGSSLRQRFRVPAGVETLRLDFNFVSEEFPEFIGSEFDDAFQAVVTTPDGDHVFAEVSVNASGGFTDVGDCEFPGGDTTCGQTGWREGSVDLSDYAGTGTPIEVALSFSAVDAGDNIYDTHVLVDNIRFSTLWVDAKILSGSNANQARVESDIKNANEILFQAGILVRLRNISTVTNPGALLDVTMSHAGKPKFVLEGEELELLGIDRSDDATDLNVYYVRSLLRVGGTGKIAGVSVQPDDYLDIGYLDNSGLFMSDAGFAIPPLPVLAHEIGHLVISPERAGASLEHEAQVSNFMKITTPPGTYLNREQSATINDAPVPLLVD